MAGCITAFPIYITVTLVLMHTYKECLTKTAKSSSKHCKVVVVVVVVVINDDDDVVAASAATATAAVIMMVTVVIVMYTFLLGYQCSAGCCGSPGNIWYTIPSLSSVHEKSYLCFLALFFNNSCHILPESLW